MEQLKKNIETVMCWRKFGKPLNKEQQAFADIVADEMIAAKVKNQVGVQLVSKEHINFIKKGMQPIQGSDIVPGLTQDVVANVHSKDGKYPRKTVEEELKRQHKERANAVAKKIDDLVLQALKEDKDVEKVAKPASDESSKEKLPTSAAETGTEPRKSPTLPSIKQTPPDNQKDGQVTAVADSKTDPKTMSPDDKAPIAIEEIGHQPNLPMPKKMAEELLANAEWGVEIGAYGSVKEGIERQLGRKDYSEFIDTDEKLRNVLGYLTSLSGE